MSIDEKSDYYDVGGIEVQAIIAAKLTPEQIKGWLLGNVIKYSCRCNHNGTAARDIEKLSVCSKLLDEHQCEIDEADESNHAFGENYLNCYVGGDLQVFQRVGLAYIAGANGMAEVPDGETWQVRLPDGTMASMLFFAGDRVELDCFFREVSSA